MVRALIEAARSGNLKKVKFLLNAGADVNEREGYEGPTALHEAIRLGYYTIAIQLIDSRADLCLEFRNMTSLIAAAAYNRSYLKDYIQTKANWSMLSLIEADELLGSSFIIYKDTSVDKGYRLFLTCLRRRQEKNYPKVVNYPLAAYGDRKECQTVEELEKIRYNMDHLHDEAFMVRERILGWDNPLIAEDLILTTHTYDTRPRAALLLKRWSRALEQLQRSHRWIGDPLAYIASCIDHIACEVPSNIQIADLEDIFNRALDEIERIGFMANLPESLQLENAEYICVNLTKKLVRNTLRLLSIAVELPKTFSQRIRLEETAHVFVKLNARYKWTHSLLISIFDPDLIEYRKAHGKSIIPSWLLFKLLMNAGESVNTLGFSKRTVLQQMELSCMIFSAKDPKAFHAIIIKLLDCGLHLCARSYYNYIKPVKEIVLSYDSSDEMKKFVKNYMFLQCVAAKVVKKFNLHNHVGIPRELRKFIELH